MRSKLCAFALSTAALFSPTLQAEIPVYGVMLSTADTTYGKALEDGLREGASIENADLYLQTSQADNAEMAIELCNSMLDRKPNVLLIATPDTEALASCFVKAKRLDIPVVGISESSDPFQKNHMTSVVLTNQTENPHMAGIKAMEQASQAINSNQ